jgi:glutamate dehydrogenase (NAD(P)+)
LPFAYAQAPSAAARICSRLTDYCILTQRAHVRPPAEQGPDQDRNRKAERNMADVRVLVVDDSAAMRALFCDILDNAKGVTVCGTAKHADEARDQLEKLRPDVLTLDVEILMPCAIDGVITDKNVHNVKAKIISEGANGPCTTSAMKVLEEKGSFIIPDVLCNAGGVIVSYFEWVQGLQNFFWSEKEVNAKLAEVMENAFKKVVTIRDQHDCGMKTAALITSVERLSQAMLLRGLFP